MENKIPTTNIIINIKTELKNIIQTHNKNHIINNTTEDLKLTYA